MQTPEVVYLESIRATLVSSLRSESAGEAQYTAVKIAVLDELIIQLGQDSSRIAPENPQLNRRDQNPKVYSAERIREARASGVRYARVAKRNLYKEKAKKWFLAIFIAITVVAILVVAPLIMKAYF